MSEPQRQDLDHPALWPALDPLHTLTLAFATKAIHAMFVAGRSIGSPGDFQASITVSPDYIETRTEATARLASVLEKVGKA